MRRSSRLRTVAQTCSVFLRHIFRLSHCIGRVYQQHFQFSTRDEHHVLQRPGTTESRNFRHWLATRLCQGTLLGVGTVCVVGSRACHHLSKHRRLFGDFRNRATLLHGLAERGLATVNLHHEFESRLSRVSRRLHRSSCNGNTVSSS